MCRSCAWAGQSHVYLTLTSISFFLASSALTRSLYSVYEISTEGAHSSVKALTKGLSPNNLTQNLSISPRNELSSPNGLQGTNPIQTTSFLVFCPPQAIFDNSIKYAIKLCFLQEEQLQLVKSILTRDNSRSTRAFRRIANSLFVILRMLQNRQN